MNKSYRQGPKKLALVIDDAHHFPGIVTALHLLVDLSDLGPRSHFMDDEVEAMAFAMCGGTDQFVQGLLFETSEEVRLVFGRTRPESGACWRVKCQRVSNSLTDRSFRRERRRGVKKGGGGGGGR